MTFKLFYPRFDLILKCPVSFIIFQVERKRHIGNDIVNIIFIDGDSCDFSPNCIKSQFTRILFINSHLVENVMSYSHCNRFVKKANPDFYIRFIVNDSNQKLPKNVYEI